MINEIILGLGTILIYGFVIATFSWMTLDGVIEYRKTNKVSFVRVVKRYSKLFLKVSMGQIFALLVLANIYTILNFNEIVDRICQIVY